MEFAFERRATPRKAKSRLRSLLGRAPDGKEIRERLGRLLPRLWKGAEVSAKRIVVELHPFAPPLRLKVEPDGAIVVHGNASMVGPGFHDEVIARLAPVLAELDYGWDGAEGDPRAEALAWLAAELRAGARRIGMLPERQFVVDAAVQTALGPRDAAWRDAVLADPAHGRDAFAWWADGPGLLERSRAVLAMWHEVPWREPIDKTELALMTQVDADLRAARKADRGLALPYAEWAELVGYLGELERAAELRAQATAPSPVGSARPTAPPNGGAVPSPIGYRRFPMEVVLDAGWSITLPGAFVGAWQDDGARYLATDGARVVEVATVETTEHDTAKLIDAIAARHPVIELAADGARQARAEAYDEDDVHIVHGLVAVAPHVAIVTCKGKRSDEAWALATWRSLRNTGT